MVRVIPLVRTPEKGMADDTKANAVSSPRISNMAYSIASKIAKSRSKKE